MPSEGVEKQELLDSIEDILDEQQQITLNEDDDTEDHSNSHAVRAKKVTISYPSDRDGDEQQKYSSHYVETKPCLEYKWEKTYYHGHLIAVHMSGKIFAYALQTHHAGKVRVTNDDPNNSSEGRCLLKEFSTQLVDIDFAHVPDAVYIACMEQDGWCTVFSISDAKPMTYELMVKIRINNDPITNGTPCRAIWCVHVPEAGKRPFFPNVQDPCNRLILASGGNAVVVSVPVVQNAAGPEKSLVIASTKSKGVALTAPGATIWDGKMSPDGVVLCVARDDGNVHFYQCVLEKGDSLVEEQATCVYTWIPHDGRAVHSIHFFDDFTQTSQQEQFWMFALSGSEFGQQFKIWNCQHWYCLQTVDILPAVDRPLLQPRLQVTIDPKGQYLILADTNRNLLMFLRVDKDLTKRVASVTCLNEFFVGAPILNMVAVDLSAIRPARQTLVAVEAEDNGLTCRMLTLHQQVLQHMVVSYVGEQLPSNIPNDGSRPYADNQKQNLGSAGQNGDQKIRKKKAKKIRDTYPTLDDVPTPSAPVHPSEFPTNGIESYNRTEATYSPQSHSPTAFVLQPPSAFDGVATVRRDSSQQNSNSPSVVTKDLLEYSNLTTPIVNTLFGESKREESVANNLSSFGAPPVEENAAMSLSGAEMERTSRLGYPSGDHLRAETASSERFERLEMMLSTIATVVERQSQLLERMAATMDEKAKPAVVSQADQEQVLKKGLDVLAKSLAGPVQDMKGLEGRLAGIVDTLGKNLESSLSKEMKNQLGQNMQKSLKPVGDKLSADVLAKLAGMDVTVRQRLDEVIRSPQFNAAIAQSISPQFSELAKQVLQDIVTNQLVASYQQVMNSSLVVLNQTFGNGTTEYLNQVNRSLDGHFTRIDESFEERVHRLEDSTVRTCTAAMQTVTADLLKELQVLVERNMEHLYNQIMANLGGQISQKVTSFVKDEMREQQSVLHETMLQAIRSGAVTPGGQVAVHQQKLQQAVQEVKSAIAKQDFNTAFRVALSASDLSLVLFVCENVNVKEVFGKTPILHMPVLFSLIQQLAVDIGTKTELKIQYLEEALLAVEFKDLEPSSFKFLRTVLGDVTKGLNKFLQGHPTHANARPIRILSQLATMQLDHLGQLTLDMDRVNSSK